MVTCIVDWVGCGLLNAGESMGWMWPIRRRRRRESAAPDALLKQRVILLRGIIGHDVAVDVISRLLFLQHQDARQPILLHIESPGGTVSDTLAIVDTIRSLSPPVRTEALSIACGGAAIILAAGRKGERVVGPRAKVGLTTVWSTDPTTLTAELHLSRQELASVVAELSGQLANVVAHDLTVERFFTPGEAVAYGLADRVGVLSDDD